MRADHLVSSVGDEGNAREPVRGPTTDEGPGRNGPKAPDAGNSDIDAPLGYSSDWTNPGQRLAMAGPPAAGPGWAGGPARSAGSAPSSSVAGWRPGRGIAPGRGRRRAQAPGRTAAPGCATGGG